MTAVHNFFNDQSLLSLLLYAEQGIQKCIWKFYGQRNNQVGRTHVTRSAQESYLR